MKLSDLLIFGLWCSGIGMGICLPLDWFFPEVCLGFISIIFSILIIYWEGAKCKLG